MRILAAAFGIFAALLLLGAWRLGAIASAASPAPTPANAVTLVNNSGVSASDLHFFLIEPVPISAGVVTNAPGCASPVINVSGANGPDFTTVFDVVWPSACVDPGESVTLGFSCNVFSCPSPFISCVDWTLSGSIIGTPCPTPDCGGVPCCAGVPCPTPTTTPTAVPTSAPTAAPTASALPTVQPTASPTYKVSGLPKTGGSPEGSDSPSIALILAGVGLMFVGGTGFKVARRKGAF
jgi:hypothetical protein